MSKPQETIPKTQFLTIIWALSGIALAFLTARLVIRLKVYGRLMVDDGLVILAMTCLLISDIATTAMAPKIYIFQSVQVDHTPKPPHYEAIADSYIKYQWADAYLFFTGIWAVKGSFLAYYDDLTKRLTTFRRAWWLAIGFTILTYIGSLVAYGFLNGIKFKTSLKNEGIKYQFAADLSTDVFITVIPVTLALKSPTPAKQKLALVGVFSLSLIVTIFSIIRFSLNAPNRRPAGPSWIGAWSFIEHSVSVTVACLASFRVYVVNKRRKSKNASSHGRAMNKTNSSSQKGHLPAKVGLSDLRPNWGSSSMDTNDNRSMELQLLDAPTPGSQIQAARRPNDGEIEAQSECIHAR